MIEKDLSKDRHRQSSRTDEKQLTSADRAQMNASAHILSKHYEHQHVAAPSYN